MGRLRRHAVLVVTTVALAVVEATLVVAVGPADAAPLAPQVAAPPPFGVFHDLRWLLVYHPSWLVFVVGALALVAARAALDCALVRAAWPPDQEPPSLRTQLTHAARFTAATAAALVLFAVLTFALAFTSLSWLFFVAVPVLLMVALLVHHGDVVDAWWRDPPIRASVTTVLWVFALLTVGGSLIAAVPRPVAPVLAGVTAFGIAVCRLRSVGALATHGATPSPVRATRRWPYALVGLAAVLALVLGGTAVGFAVSSAVEAGRTPPARARFDAAGTPVLVVKGFNSRWDGVTYRWVRGHHRIRRFSYRGLDARGRPLTYGRDDTHRGVLELAREMGRQVDALHEEIRSASSPRARVRSSRRCTSPRPRGRRSTRSSC
jgi:hypothetical protein